LEHRVGDLPRDAAARLHGLSARQLDALAKAIFDLESAADFEAWMDQRL
jgi:hypothetical protein